MQRALLAATYDGPVPPAELAAAHWGAGALPRQAMAAARSMAEARLARLVRVIAALRGLCTAPLEHSALSAVTLRVAALRNGAVAEL